MVTAPRRQAGRRRAPTAADGRRPPALSSASRCRPAPGRTTWPRPGRDRLVHGAANGALGRLDPATRRTTDVPLGTGSAPHGVIVGPDGAAWVTDSGLNAIVRVDADHQRGQALPAAGRPAGRQPQHRRLRPAGDPVVHRPVRRVRPARPGQRGDGGLRRTPGPRALRDHRHPRRHRLVRLAGRQPHRPGRPDDGSGDGGRAADAGPGRPPGLERLPGAPLGQRVERRPGRPSTTRRRTPGRSGASPATSPRPTPSTSTTATSCGCPTSAPTPSSASIPATESFTSFPLPSRPSNVRQILGRPGEVWAPESAADALRPASNGRSPAQRRGQGSAHRPVRLDATASGCGRRGARPARCRGRRGRSGGTRPG